MRKKRLIALIGTLTMAAGGLTAVSAGVSNKKADNVYAASSATIKGTFDNWGNGVAMSNSGGTWSGTVTLKKNQLFKIVLGSDWIGANLTGYESGSILGEGFTYTGTGSVVDDGSNDHNFKVTTGGEYTINIADGIQGYGKTGYGFSVSRTDITPSSNKITYYLYDVDNLGWQAKAHYWVDGGDCGGTTWPGEAMTSLGNGLWSIQISETFDRIIFNNGLDGDVNKTKEHTLYTSDSTKRCFDLWDSFAEGESTRNGIWNTEGAPYFVTYNANTGTGTVPDKSVGRVSGTKATAASGQGLTKSGYKFLGWSTSSSATSPTYNVGDNVPSTTPGEVIQLFAVWQLDQKDVTISFNTNGGTPISPISGKSGNSYTKPADPTKANCTFVKWNPTLPDTLPNEDTTYDAEWKINSGTYIAVHNGTDNMEQNGKYVLSLQFEGSTLYATSLILKKGDYFRVYYVDDNGNASWEGASCTVDFHPDYPAEIINNDVNVKGEGSYTYTVYFDTTSKKYELVKDGNVRNGRYIVVNHTGGTQTLVRAEPWSGYSTYTEYKAVKSIVEGDCIKAMYQDNTQSTIYPLTLGESVKIWEPSDNGLKCPQGDPGLYSFYLISNDGANYSTVSIFKEGEDTALTYAKFFLEEVAKICDLDGHTDPGVFKPVWSPILEAKYNELGITKTNPAGLLLIDADETYENEDLKKFAYMYDYIYGKYHTYFANLDFVGRNPTDLASSSRLISINNVSTSTWIIASVAIVGIAAVGVFFIYRKRKEN